MKTRNVAVQVVCVIVVLVVVGYAQGDEAIAKIDNGWKLQSAAALDKADGAALSKAGYDVQTWYDVAVPRTVLAALVDNGVYPDPYYGENLRKIPGYQEERWLRMAEDSPFYPSWWYRCEFEVPAAFKDKLLRLHLDGINYRANVWLNGKKVAGDDKVIGMFRRFEFDVTDLVKIGAPNGLAVEVIGPGKLPDKKFRTKQVEATTGWDDHNPQPPDLNMGIWRDVYVTASGPVMLRHPHVDTDLDLPSLDKADLTVSVQVINVGGKRVRTTLSGAIEDITFSQEIELWPDEQRWIRFSPAQFPKLTVQQPRVWWPNPLGAQELYDVALEAKVDDVLSDATGTRFGIREATTYIDDEGWRGYRINGQNVLIRGGAWMTNDMLLRFTKKRDTALVRYAREANLNMLRSEGFSIRETDQFYDICDELGVMVTQQLFGRSIPDEDLAIACIQDTILRIRNHPSLVHFLGHDETFPTDRLDEAYRGIIAKYSPGRTYQPHSGAFEVENRFSTGGTRTGTRELWTYAGPARYYDTDYKERAWGFAQSGGIGGIVAQVESVRRMIPEEDLWPLWSGGPRPQESGGNRSGRGRERWPSRLPPRARILSGGSRRARHLWRSKENDHNTRTIPGHRMHSWGSSFLFRPFAALRGGGFGAALVVAFFGVLSPSRPGVFRLHHPRAMRRFLRRFRLSGPKTPERTRCVQGLRRDFPVFDPSALQPPPFFPRKFSAALSGIPPNRTPAGFSAPDPPIPCSSQ